MNDKEHLAKLGERIHEVMNNTVHRKLTVEEYKRVVNLIFLVFKRAS